MSDLIDAPDGPGSNAPEFTVSEISGAVKKTLEGAFGRIRVRGEVGRVFRARSGHLYYDIKDERNVLACTTWKGQLANLTVMPEEGMEVIVSGRLTAFGAQSKYNLNVEQVEPAGAGALMAMLEKRKKQLAAEGLFEEARKRPLPFLPEIIGVVTSPSGAVIRDILHRLRDRFPRKVLIWPVAVQGRDCAPQVAAAIEGFNRLSPGGPLPRPDVIIVARGGGSIEDLWGFNEEIVARAAAASQIPLISAVGHETDTTLIDFVSDRRAPTPTAAAEMAVPVRLELLAHLDSQGARLSGALSRNMTRRGERLRDLARALPRPDSLLATPRQRYDNAASRLPLALRTGVQSRRLGLARITAPLRPRLLTQRLQSLSDRLEASAKRLVPALARGTSRARQDLDARAARLSPAPLLRENTRRKERLAELSRRLQTASQTAVAGRRDRLSSLERILQSLNYEETLKRGYAVIRGDGAVVTTKAAAEQARNLEIQFADGRLNLGQTKTAKPRKDKPEQGSLF
ncbi:exodeoxyribonuclease VII large subunit [Aliiruegeria sabulilitoris]|uniref:exodeoxyribonuclease VII large subunit n=1 Tax=Aliiruegeria sabulilitoris TaxID=1510458 RepID=UPI00082A0683|nr:exodeoxyribonuclease VII large subunit [Aliiruegeria sabulilitoris]NDR56901.1 exodeoxyribonuclease VII large subunit [Pseudoruegeria sp. M32A2M]